MASFTTKGQTLELFVPHKGSVVTVAISGSYDQVIKLQVEIGSKGSGAWAHVRRFDVENATEAYDYATKTADETVRLVLSVDDGGEATVTLTNNTDTLSSTIEDAAGNILASFFTSGPTFPGTLTYSVLSDGTTALTASTLELNYLDLTAAIGTGTASEVMVLDSGEDWIWPSGGKLTYGGTQITANGAEINYLDLTGSIGTAEASKALVLDANKRLVWTTTSSSTVNPIAFTSTMTGAGTTGGRALFQLNVEASLGGWSNALKAIVVYNASGRTVGMGSAFVAELQLSTNTGTGHYAPLEAEIVVGSSGSVGQGTSFIYMNVADDSNTFRDGGLLFELGDGITAGTGGLLQTIAEATVASTHSLKIMIANTAYYIPINTSQDI